MATYTHKRETNDGRTVEFDVVNPKPIEEEWASFYIGTWQEAFAPDRLCAVVKPGVMPFAFQYTGESHDEFVERAGVEWLQA